ncbi:MAG: TIGR00295 family protein [Archaeoglobaceae archaeon]
MKVPEWVEKLWDKYGLSEDVRRHCIAVAELAVKIAEKVARCRDVDVELVRVGALLHDIGRAVTHDPFRHFLASSEILRREGVDERIVRIAERHFSAGLRAEEAAKLGLEARDYIPKTLEEKIVSYADNLTFGSRHGSFEDFIRRLDEIDARNPELRWLTEVTKERAKRMKEEIERAMEC